MRRLLLGLVAALGAVTEAPALTLSASGEPETVVAWQRDACDRRDVPDAPARAFRDADGKVRLVAAYARARSLTGDSLDTVRPDCAVVYEGSGRDDPALNDDRSWISSFYTLDGRSVFALVSNEFHGQRRPHLCPSGEYMRCWRNSVTEAISTDGGRRFAPIAEPPAHVVAALPYPYAGDVGRRTGYFAPTNIIRHGDHWYAFVWAERYEAQKRGACLLRTDDLADPRAWRGWDGAGFTVRFVDGAREPVAAPERHVCKPVAPGILGNTVRSIVLHRPTGTFVATFAGTRDGVTGIWASLSRDLVSWEKPQLVWKAPLLFRYGCGDEAAFDYPSLLDPAAKSRNFEDIGDTPYLYMTRLNLKGCKVTWDRDLVRLPLRIERGR
ncbi:MAG: hypothetical protein IRZ04_00965 [Rhodospirillales bacterium]|nr:hypothetical protein [Rhodospirillales bacterium]